MSKNLKVKKVTNLGCYGNFSHGAVIRIENGRSLGVTCDPMEAENIIKAYFQTEFFPEPVHVFFDGAWGYTFSLAE